MTASPQWLYCLGFLSLQAICDGNHSHIEGVLMKPCYVKILHLKPTSPAFRSSHLVSDFDPFEKYLSNWESSPNRGENKKYLKRPPSHALFFLVVFVDFLPC